MEFALFTEGGMSPMDVVFSATKYAAELLGASDQVGSVQAGRYADLVATDGDPLQDPGEFERIRFVMKGGIVYREGGKPTSAGAH